MKTVRNNSSAKRAIAIIILTLMVSGFVVGSYLFNPNLLYSVLGIIAFFLILNWCLVNLDEYGQGL